ncbi:unnamed protein product, partial [Coregonus sp. 'balchen']
GLTLNWMDRGGLGCSSRELAMAGQSAEIWQTFLWGIPYQQRVGADCCSLLSQVRTHKKHRAQKNHTSTSNLVVSVGRQSQEGSNPNEVSRTVTQIICHPNYISSTSDNDMCLLKLSSPVTFTNHIRPVCLAAPGSSFYAGTTSWGTGCAGTISSGVSLPSPQTPQELYVPLVGNRQSVVCGSVSLNSLTGMDSVSMGSWPRIASLQTNGTHVCGGTTVSEDYVMSDAGCFS